MGIRTNQNRLEEVVKVIKRLHVTKLVVLLMSKEFEEKSQMLINLRQDVSQMKAVLESGCNTLLL